MLDEMTWPNASKFAIFNINENPKLLFPFFISTLFSDFIPPVNFADWKNISQFHLENDRYALAIMSASQVSYKYLLHVDVAFKSLCRVAYNLKSWS